MDKKHKLFLWRHKVCLHEKPTSRWTPCKCNNDLEKKSQGYTTKEKNKEINGLISWWKYYMKKMQSCAPSICAKCQLPDKTIPERWWSHQNSSVANRFFTKLGAMVFCISLPSLEINPSENFFHLVVETWLKKETIKKNWRKNLTEVLRKHQKDNLRFPLQENRKNY